MLRRSISGTVQYTSRSGGVDATCDTLEITCQSAVLVVSAQIRAHRQQNMKAAKSLHQPANPDEDPQISNTASQRFRPARYSTPPEN
jgi:hypothetical protein